MRNDTTGKIENIIGHFELREPVGDFERRYASRAKWRVMSRILDHNGASTSLKQQLLILRFLRIAGFRGELKDARTVLRAIYAAMFLLIAGSAYLLIDPAQQFRKSGTVTAALVSLGDSVRMNNRSVQSMDSLSAGDTILTENDPALITLDRRTQFSTDKKTKTTVASLGENLRLVVDAGGVVVRFVPGKIKSISVATPNATVTVRGTTFAVNYEEGKTSVYLLHGSVEVSSAERTALLSSRESAFITDSGISVVRQGNDDIFEAVSRIDQLPPPKNGLNYQVDEMPLLKKVLFPEGNSDGKEKIQKDPQAQALAELKEKYGRLEIIEFNNGRKIKGVILKKGDFSTINTVSGTIIVRSGDIKKTYPVTDLNSK